MRVGVQKKIPKKIAGSRREIGEHFRLAFDDDATVFHPRAMPQLANGRSEFEKAFKAVFQQIRGNKAAAPYMGFNRRT